MQNGITVYIKDSWNKKKVALVSEIDSMKITFEMKTSLRQKTPKRYTTKNLK